MKIFKNLTSTIILAIVMLISVNVSAQKVEKFNLSNKIPQENFVFQNDKKLKSFTDYEKFKEYGAIIEVKGYVENGFVKINSIVINGKDLTKLKENLRMMAYCDTLQCMRDCTRNTNTESGTLLCTVYCIIDAFFC
ncbi:hypothetical protein [Xanthomarina sp. F2636L]|uniref:hypothetical protein n=1 Tax=Xanthomarina sp. F2636L TaxID=2996018 RepID=UPI00225DF9D8|nr:hypothetical protein [Xanthomarina sp. F2636L]MCX7549516.1 hypothetical protein [Xanthomarina sp. F2636L]